MSKPSSIPDLSRDPDALRVMTRPVLVAVRFADEDGTCATLEGSVRYRAGDAIVTGALGEQWPISRDRFEQTYERVSDGRYRKRPAMAHALRLKAAMRVQVGGEGDVLEGQPGDWLLQYGDGRYGIVDADVFAQSYETVDDAGPTGAAGSQV
ncbi:PGDYG domain-containing protein [Paraburkholderia oxyphila]|uniref:PGDYG domain-containing protein n=1 Tax=Paraburkholderia oxyphila TaxID=614212 RepID=UPI00047FFF26|nr:PGDYG domain-containing protein [Paraburkholderia oxyphila]